MSTSDVQELYELTRKIGLIQLPYENFKYGGKYSDVKRAYIEEVINRGFSRENAEHDANIDVPDLIEDYQLYSEYLNKIRELINKGVELPEYHYFDELRSGYVPEYIELISDALKSKSEVARTLAIRGATDIYPKNLGPIFFAMKPTPEQKSDFLTMIVEMYGDDSNIDLLRELLRISPDIIITENVFEHLRRDLESMHLTNRAIITPVFTRMGQT